MDINWRDPAIDEAYRFISNHVKTRKRDFLAEKDSTFLEIEDEVKLEEWIQEGIQLHRSRADSRRAQSESALRLLSDREYGIIAGGRIMLEEHPLGALSPFFKNPTINEIRILGTDCYFIKDGIKEYTRLDFADEDALRDKLVNFFASRSQSRRIDDANPLATLILPNGDRCHIALKVVSRPLAITIRRHQPEKFPSFEALLKVGAFPDWLIHFFRCCIRARLNILVAGGLGTGKTTWLRVIGATFPDDERIGTIEDDPELYLRDLRKYRMRTAQGMVELPPDCFSLVGRGANIEGEGEVTMTRLVKESLRMSADRVLVGEVRGKEALDMIKAMSAGYPGSACTIHSESAEDALFQLQGYAMEHPDAPRDPEMMMRRICRSINMIVYLRRVKQQDGRYKPLMDHISIVTGFGEDTRAPRIQKIVQYDDLQRNWDWVGQHPRTLGTQQLRNKFLAAEIDLDTMIPAEALKRMEEDKLSLS